MNFPTVTGIIDRRILVNFAADKDIVSQLLPAPFKVKLIKGKALVGICLIRLKSIRTKGIPAPFGLVSENAAHRIAVEWEENGLMHEGVYIPRRDTSSHINSFTGGRFFPGVHHLSEFRVREEGDDYKVEFHHQDGTSVRVHAVVSDRINEHSVFPSIESACDFFKAGAVGYSPSRLINVYDGIELSSTNWIMKPMDVIEVHSTYFENETLIPAGSMKLDSAFLMLNVTHEWVRKPRIFSTAEVNQ